MAKIARFEDLEAWQLARQLTAKVYEATLTGKFAKDYGLRAQIQRAAVSIVSNIAEGFDRKSNKQFLQFLDVASGSASEVKAQLYVALDLKYLTNEQFQDMFTDAVRVGQMLTKLMQYLRTIKDNG
jgi:four helix bundle protein